jgi:hypothetical protein
MATTTSKTPRRPKGHGRSLDEMRAALIGLGKDLHAGGRDLFGDVETLVRSARRDTSKLGKALRADVERLAKSRTSLPAPPAPHARRRSAPKPRRPAGSQSKKTAA